MSEHPPPPAPSSSDAIGGADAAPTDTAQATVGRPRRTWRRRMRRIAPWIGLLLTLGAFAAYELKRGPFVYFEPDPSAYLHMAKRIAHFQPMGLIPDDPYLYQNHTWVENLRGEVLPKYNPGYPLLLAIGYWIGGDNAMLAVSPVMGLLGLLGMWFLARQWMRPLAAGFAVASLGLSWMYLLYGAYTLTHSANLCCATWGMYGLWRWRRKGGWWAPALGGFGLAMAMAVRYTSALLVLVLPCLVLARLLTLRRRRAPLRQQRLAVAQALLSGAVIALGAGLLAWYHQRWFGSPLITGYSLSQEQSGFAVADIAKNARLLLGGLTGDLGLLLIPVGIVGCVAVGSTWDRLARIAWILPIYLCYSAYYWSTNSSAYYRFMFVTLPCFTLGAFLLLDRLPRQRLLGRVLPMLVILIFAIGWQAERLIGDITPHPRRMIGVTWRLAQDMDRHLPPDATVFIAQPVYDYLSTRAAYRAFDSDVLTGRRDPYPRHHSTPRAQPIREMRFARRYRLQSRSDDLVHERIAASLAAGQAVAMVVVDRDERRMRQSLRDYAVTELARQPTFTAAERARHPILPEGDWVLLGIAPLPAPDTPAPPSR